MAAKRQSEIEGIVLSIFEKSILVGAYKIYKGDSLEEIEKNLKGIIQGAYKKGQWDNQEKLKEALGL